MTRRVKLHIDKLVHINDVVFEVFRSNEPGVDEHDEHIMTVDDKLAIKQTYTEKAEILSRDPYTPYALISKRHFETVPFPAISIGSDVVASQYIEVFPDDKTVEVHSGDMGLFDGRTVYMDYEYKAIPVRDDKTIEHGKTHLAEPATGLRTPLDFDMVQDFTQNRIHLTFKANPEPFVYFYRIYARDAYGSLSPWSDEHFISLVPSEVFFRIQRSADKQDWEDTSYSNMLEWFDQVRTTDNPRSVQNINTIPVDSKEAAIIFDNPWYHYKDDERTSYHYRIRAEDSDGYFTEWIYLDPITLYIKPKEVFIRRKLDNGLVSSKTGIDALDLYKLTEADVDINSPIISLVDDELTDNSIYSYTFFLTDVLDKEAKPVYSVSDQTPWANVILFGKEKHTETLRDEDFVMSFELADRIIEIGDKEA